MPGVNIGEGREWGDMSHTRSISHHVFSAHVTAAVSAIRYYTYNSKLHNQRLTAATILADAAVTPPSPK